MASESDQGKLLADLSAQGLRPASPEEFEFYRIRAGWPKRNVDYDDESMILAVGLRQGVAFGKGCYPGQEVVERATAIGSSPKTLVTVQLDSLPAGTPPLPVAIDGKEVGKLTSWASFNGCHLGLGQIRTKQVALQGNVSVKEIHGEIIARH